MALQGNIKVMKKQKKILIEGLTRKQIEIIDVIKNCINAEEIALYIMNLPKEDRMIAKGVLDFLHIESQETDWKLEEREEFPEAAKVLSNFDHKGSQRFLAQEMRDWLIATEDVPYPTDEEIQKAMDEDRDPFDDPIYLKRLSDFYLANPDRFTPRGELKK